MVKEKEKLKYILIYNLRILRPKYYTNVYIIIKFLLK